MAVPAATSELAQQVGRLAPFGAGNEEPIFALPRARVVRADRIGKEGNTIRAFVEGEAGGRLKAICFRAKEGPLAEALLARNAGPLHLCGQLRAERSTSGHGRVYTLTYAGRDVAGNQRTCTTTVSVPNGCTGLKAIKAARQVKKARREYAAHVRRGH